MSLKFAAATPGLLTGGASLTGTVTLYGPAPAGGAVVTLSNIYQALTAAPPLVVTNPVALPASVTVPEGATSASFTFTANHVSDLTWTRIAADLNGFSTNAELLVYPILGGIDFGFDTVLGGTSKTGTVRLRAPAPPGGAFVPLSSSDLTLVSVPPSVTVPAGAMSADFTANTSPVPAFTFATVTAVYDGATIGKNLFLRRVSIAGLFFTPSTVVGGNVSTGTVTLSDPAAAGGSVVTLASNSSLATFPASVTVPAGATSATFTVNTSPVGVFTSVGFTGTLEVLTQAILTVTPPPPGPVLSTVSLNPISVVGGTPATGTVTLSAPALSGGGTVTLSCNSSAATVPATIMVPAGATSATFTVTTTSVTASTSAIVNAGYGGVSKSATLTVNPAAASAPAAPSLISPADQATVAQPILFDWTDVANAATYEIQIATSGNFTPPLTFSQTVSVSQATISGLPAQRLFWRVRGINAAGVAGPFSVSRRFTAQAAPPAPPPPAAASLSAVSVTPASVVGGSSANGTVTLTSAAPTGGLVVTLSSSNTTVASLPASVTVAVGATSATFAVTTSSVATATAITITGTQGATTRTATLTVNSVPPPASLSTITLSPPTVTGGGPATGTITVTSAAPSGGLVVTLSSSNTTVASLPASVTVAAGATSATFAITTGSVTSATAITITGSGGGAIRTATLTVNPQAAGALLTLTATGRAGESVSSSPAGLIANVGTTGSSSFPTGTLITLTVSNGRVAIWSGGCSSNGAKVKSCSFTINAATSVTANVQ